MEDNTFKNIVDDTFKNIVDDTFKNIVDDTFKNIVDDTFKNIVDDTFKNIVDNTFKNIVDNTFKNIVDDTFKNIAYTAYTHEGSAPKTCFCTGRACPMYEQCFEKDKVIDRQNDVIKNLMKRIIQEKNTPKENQDGNGF